MKKLAAAIAVLAVTACDKKEEQTAPTPDADQQLSIPVFGESFLVVEQLGEADEPFPAYKTYEVVPTESGAETKQDFDGFHMTAKGREWSWNVEEKTVEGSRDCTCETFSESCTADTTMMVAELSQQGKEQRWRPPIYTNATDGLASWRTSRARAWVRGDLLFTSVCLEVMKCGETPRPVCQSTVWSIAGEEPKVVEMDTLATGPGDTLLADELEKAEPRSKAQQALQQAVDADSTPVLVELQPTWDGDVTQRWVVPSDIRATGDWTAYTFSVMHTGESAGDLKPYAPLPRAVSIFSGKRDASFVGWSVRKGESGEPTPK